MLKNKQIFIIIGLTVIFLLILFSWNLFQEKQKPIIAKPVDVTASVVVDGEKFMSDGLIDVIYKWQPGSTWTSIKGDPRIFVHLQDEYGERLCQDDHVPPVPINQWKKGQSYEYKRTMYIPITMIKKKVFLLTGIYDHNDPAKYFSIKGLKKYNPYFRYLAKAFILIPSDKEYSDALIKYLRGWYDPEVDKRGNVMWRWMKKHAECQLVNPKTDAILFINLWVPNVHLNKKAVIKLKVAGKVIDLPPLVNNSLVVKLNFSKKQLGNDDQLPMELITDQTFVPAREGNSVDARELGLMVKKILFRAK